MAIDLNAYTKVISDEYFNGYNAQNGEDVVLTPKNKGKLTFDGDIEVPGSMIVGSVPGSIIEGGVTKDDDGNVNLGVEAGDNKNTIDGNNNVAFGAKNDIDGDNNIVSGYNNTVADTAINSSIIGGQNNTNNKSGSVILGGDTITAYRDNTTYVPDLEINGVQVFGVDPISRKFYGEFNRQVNESTSMVVPHAVTSTAEDTVEGYIKLIYKGDSTITSALFDSTTLTCDGSWKEVIIPTANHGLTIALEGTGSFSYVAEINESIIVTE